MVEGGEPRALEGGHSEDVFEEDGAAGCCEAPQGVACTAGGEGGFGGVGWVGWGAGGWCERRRGLGAGAASHMTGRVRGRKGWESPGGGGGGASWYKKPHCMTQLGK